MLKFKLYFEKDLNLVKFALTDAGLAHKVEVNGSYATHNPHVARVTVEATVDEVKSIIKKTNALHLAENF